MRLDEWGLRKNNCSQGVKLHRARTKSERGRKKHEELDDGVFPKRGSSLESAGSSATPSPFKSLEKCRVVQESTIPERPMTASECCAFTQCLSPVNLMLEALLLKWQPDGAFLKTAIENLKKEFAVLHLEMPTSDGENMFHLIDRSLKNEEKTSMIKECLRADSIRPRLIPVTLELQLPAWLSSWRAALRKSSWDDTKAELRNHCNFPDVLGRSFLPCALIVAAEKRLRSCGYRLEELRFRLSHADFLQHSDSHLYCRKYMDILQDECCVTLDDPELLRYSLRISEWDRATATTSAQGKNQPHPSPEILGCYDFEPFVTELYDQEWSVEAWTS